MSANNTGQCIWKGGPGETAAARLRPRKLTYDFEQFAIQEKYVVFSGTVNDCRLKKRIMCVAFLSSMDISDV